MPSDELPSLKGQVGKTLINELDDKGLDNHALAVANLFHEGVTPEEEPEQAQLAELSSQASKKAGDQLALFESAGKFAAIGVETLPTSKWLNHCELVLDLCSAAAETAKSLGSIENLEICYNAALGQRGHPLFDKLVRTHRAVVSHALGTLARKTE